MTNYAGTWDTIIAFIKPLETFIVDPTVSDILVNPSGRVFVERSAVLAEVEGVNIGQKQLQVAIRHIARSVGDDINEHRPLLDARLPDGSRVAAVFEPCSVGGVTLAIRKFNPKRFKLDDLVEVGTLTSSQAQILSEAVQRRRNIIVSGCTGSGKTTLLNALATTFPDAERVVVIEDTVEIRLDSPNQVRLEARRAQPGVQAITIRDLLKTTLRLRPDRILLGEIRGDEAFDLLQLLNSGHGGSVSTIHADSASMALTRLASCVLQAGVGLPYAAIRSSIADAVHLAVHTARKSGKRLVTEIVELNGFKADTDSYHLTALTEPNRQ